MDLNKQAEQASKTMMGVIGIFIKMTIGLVLFFSFLFKAAKARRALREQYLLGSLYTSIEQKVSGEIGEKEDWYFRIIWRFFHGLSPGWAAAVSAILTVFFVDILNDLLFGVFIYNESVRAFINLLNWPLLFFIFFHYKPKFVHYLALLPTDTTSLMHVAGSYGLGTPDGQPEKAFLAKVPLKKALVLGQSTSIPLTERRTHMYVIGRIGSGKSKAAEYWFTQDALQGRGCALIDPHGDLADNALRALAVTLYEKGVKLADLAKDPLVQRIRLIDPTDPEFAIGYNPLQHQEGIDPYMQAKQMEDTFKKVWKFDEADAPVMSEVLRNMSYALIKNKLTLLEATLLLTNKDMLERLTENVDNSEMTMFWQDRYTRWLSDMRNTKNESTLNKISSFAADTYLRPMLGQEKSTINFREAMDNSDILIFKLAKGKLGSSANLLGAFFIASLHLAAVSREDVSVAKRAPFYVYVDEFQNFTSANFEEILREDRKYGLHYTLINQDLGSIDEVVRHAIFGNVNATVAFQIGDVFDAERVATRFFQLTGTMARSVKHAEVGLPGLGIPTIQEEADFHSVDAEAKLRAQELRLLPPRMFVVKYNGLASPQVDITVNVETTDVPEEIIEQYVRKIKEIANKRDAHPKRIVVKQIEKRLQTLLAAVVHENERGL